jgi:DNA-binding MarR family transcriptional regulator
MCVNRWCEAVHRQARAISRVHLLLHEDSRHAPMEADFRRFFRVTPRVVHQTIKTLHAHGFIEREPGKARSITLCLTRAQLPACGERQCALGGKK